MSLDVTFLWLYSQHYPPLFDFARTLLAAGVLFLITGNSREKNNTVVVIKVNKYQPMSHTTEKRY